MKIHANALGALAVLTYLATPTQAQTITAVLLEGDAVGSVGNMTRIDNLDVNDSGQWLIEVVFTP